jgi:hypothetical protein
MAVNASRPVGDAAAQLQDAVRAALEALADLSRPAPPVIDGRIHAALGRALSYQPASSAAPHSALARGTAATRAACAHLAAGSLVDAYLALRTAFEHLESRAAD